jgi:excisionase family DNA binding protein
MTRATELEFAALASTTTPPVSRLAYSIPNAAAELSISRARLYELLKAGEIAFCKIGKRSVIPASELLAFLERHQVRR